jgi:DNA-binding transcriptional LysR family regulator
MDLNELVVFAKVVEAGSFVGASRELSIPKSTVSRKVSELEERLGARLLQRTTRQLSLTDAGRAYYRHAARVLHELGEAELAVTRMQEVPRGLLRVTTPINVAYLGRLFTTFLEAFPEVSLELVCTQRVVDLVEEGFDVSLRIGRLADSSLIARYLGSEKSHVVASPAFLAGRTLPKHPDDLKGVPVLAFGALPDPQTWRLVRGDEHAKVSFEPRFVVNDLDLVHRAVLEGIGVALLPSHRICDDLNEGRLARVLPEWCAPATPFHAVYPSTRHLSPKVKAFVDHLQEKFAEVERSVQRVSATL